MRRLSCVFLLMLSFTAIRMESAWAYIEPGSASYILHIIIGVFVGGFAALINFKDRVKDFVVRRILKREESEE